MNASAAHEHVTTILTSWFSHVSAWTPPGDSQDAVCMACQRSVVRDVIDVTEWPHAVVHPLVFRLDEAIGDISASLAEELGDTSMDCERAARALVLASVTESIADILDVLEQCVSHRLDAYVREQAAWGWAAFELSRLSGA